MMHGYLISTPALAVVSILSAACDAANPQEVVVNKLDKAVLVRDVGFNGCAREEVLTYGEAATPGRSLPGKDRIHFKRFNARSYCREQAADGTITGVCSCTDGEQTVGGEMDPGLINETPLWFNYQTVLVKHVNYGQFHVFELHSEDL